ARSVAERHLWVRQVADDLELLEDLLAVDAEDARDELVELLGQQLSRGPLDAQRRVEREPEPVLRDLLQAYAQHLARGIERLAADYHRVLAADAEAERHFRGRLDLESHVAGQALELHVADPVEVVAELSADRGGDPAVDFRDDPG